MSPWRCLILPAGLMTSVCHATSHPTELFTPDALPCGALCMWHDMSLSHYVCFHVFFIFADYHLCIHLCHVYLQLRLMPLRNRSYWPRGHVSDPGDGAREDLRGPAGGIWFRFACIWAMMQHCREMKKYTLNHIDNHCHCSHVFSFGGKLAFAKTTFDSFGLLQSCITPTHLFWCFVQQGEWMNHANLQSLRGVIKPFSIYQIARGTSDTFNHI